MLLSARLERHLSRGEELMELNRVVFEKFDRAFQRCEAAFQRNEAAFLRNEAAFHRIPRLSSG